MSLLLALVGEDAPVVVVGRRTKHYSKAYLKRGHEVLVFSNDDEKENFLDAEIKAKEAIEKARQQRKVIVKKLPKPAQTVELKGLQQQANRYEIQADIAQILAQQDFERLLMIHTAILAMQDEEDIEILLTL
jgi:hypothetical protein